MRRGRLDQNKAQVLLKGIGFACNYAGLADADLVVEAVFEDIDVKREVFARLGAICRPDAVLATNTSYLDPRAIAVGRPHPERFIWLHFFSPANVMKLLEIVPLPETDGTVLANGLAGWT